MPPSFVMNHPATRYDTKREVDEEKILRLLQRAGQADIRCLMLAIFDPARHSPSAYEPLRVRAQSLATRLENAGLIASLRSGPVGKKVYGLTIPGMHGIGGHWKESRDRLESINEHRLIANRFLLLHGGSHEVIFEKELAGKNTLIGKGLPAPINGRPNNRKLPDGVIWNQETNQATLIEVERSARGSVGLNELTHFIEAAILPTDTGEMRIIDTHGQKWQPHLILVIATGNSRAPHSIFRALARQLLRHQRGVSDFVELVSPHISVWHQIADIKGQIGGFEEVSWQDLYDMLAIAAGRAMRKRRG